MYELIQMSASVPTEYRNMQCSNSKTNVTHQSEPMVLIVSCNPKIVAPKFSLKEDPLCYQ